MVCGCAPLEAAPPIDPGPVSLVVQTVPYQEILTPVPVRMAVPARLDVDRVVLYYRGFGSPRWAASELSRDGANWEGMVDCLEVSTVTGELHFFLHGRDRQGRIVVASGSPERPYSVPIVEHAATGPATIEGAPPLWRCTDPADCPPDFPGCPYQPWRRPPCGNDGSCAEGWYCQWDGYCDPSEPALSAKVW